jgi:hypothetical protein
VAPRWALAGHRQQLVGHVARGRRSPRRTPRRRAIVLRRDHPTVPTQNRLGRRERRQLGQHGPAEPISLLGRSRRSASVSCCHTPADSTMCTASSASTKPSSEDDGEWPASWRGARPCRASTKPSSEDDGERGSSTRKRAPLSRRARGASTKPSSEDDGERRAQHSAAMAWSRFNEAVVRRRRRAPWRGSLTPTTPRLQRSRRPKTTERELMTAAPGPRRIASTKPSSEDDGEAGVRSQVRHLHACFNEAVVRRRRRGGAGA